MFFVGNAFAQKIYKKSISSNSKEIFIEFDIIDHLELIVLDEQNSITIIAESEDKIAQDFVLEEDSGFVLIKGKNNSFVDNQENINKFCNIQPIYSSYKIKIPPDRILNVTFSEGNFYANSFKGSLNLKLNEGIVKINDFKGNINVQMTGGNMYCNGIENVNIDVKSNLGFVSSELFIEDKNQLTHEIKDLFGKALNELKVRAISANIHLKAK